jgi:hypothetical protein
MLAGFQFFLFKSPPSCPALDKIRADEIEALHMER